MKYYTADEIRLHNSEDDCWVSIFDDVYDITDLIAKNRGPLVSPLIENAGQSISHWFNPKTRNVKTHIDPTKNIEVPYTPYGRFLHVSPPFPMANVSTTHTPWWHDNKYIIGKVTKKTRIVRILNMLTKAEDVINTCSEEKIDEMQDRYMEYNKHAKSYTWKAIVNDNLIELDMDKTLEENGVPDEAEKFRGLGLDDDFYVPTLHIYFNDDLTYA